MEDSRVGGVTKEQKGHPKNDPSNKNERGDLMRKNKVTHYIPHCMKCFLSGIPSKILCISQFFTMPRNHAVNSQLSQGQEFITFTKMSPNSYYRGVPRAG